MFLNFTRIVVPFSDWKYVETASEFFLGLRIRRIRVFRVINYFLFIHILFSYFPKFSFVGRWFYIFAINLVFGFNILADGKPTQNIFTIALRNHILNWLKHFHLFVVIKLQRKFSGSATPTVRHLYSPFCFENILLFSIRMSVSHVKLARAEIRLKQTHTSFFFSFFFFAFPI